MRTPLDPLDFTMSARARRVLLATQFGTGSGPRSPLAGLTMRTLFLEAGPLIFLKLPGCGRRTMRELLRLQLRMLKE